MVSKSSDHDNDDSDDSEMLDPRQIAADVSAESEPRELSSSVASVS